MAPECESQIKLMTLLRYRNNGNYSLFQRLADLSGFSQDDSNPFLHFNLFTAYSICGLIEVSRTPPKTYWASTNHNYLKVNSRKKKEILSSNKLLGNPSLNIRPLVVDEKNYPMVIGNDLEEDYRFSQDSLVIDDSVWKLLPNEKFLHESCLDEEGIVLDHDRELNFFDIGEKKWVVKSFDQVDPCGLVKYRKQDYSPEYLYILFNDLNLQFRILEVDWAYILAMRMLNWRINDLFRIGQDTIKIPASVRMPTVILRFLFGESTIVKTGRSLIFSGLSPGCIKHFKEYVLGDLHFEN